MSPAPPRVGRSSYARGTLRALGPVAAAGAVCWGLSLLPYTGDTGPAIDMGIRCVMIQLVGAAGGGFVATRFDPALDVSVGILGGFVACATLWSLELAVVEASAIKLVLLILPFGAIAAAFGSVLGRVAGLRRERRNVRSGGSPRE